MDKQQKLTYQKGIEDYLSQQNVYDLFEDLLKGLIVKQPDDPINYLIEKLANPDNQTKKVFLIGPPGFKVRQLALQVADYYKFTTISVGDILRKEVGKRLELGQSIEDHFKNFTLVPDQIVINLVKKEIETIQKENKSFILSGFPRTRAQGLAMQKAGIFPDAFLIINVDNDKMEGFCDEKFKANEKVIDKQILNERAKVVKDHCLEYELNIKQVKQIYKGNYFEIDGNNPSPSLEEILGDMARLLKFKIKSKRPKRPASIVIVGGSKEVRSEFSLKLSKRYGFSHISARELLVEQVGKNSEVGRLALEKLQKKELIEDSIINGLVQNRLGQVDCQLQGYVLEGYPKTLGQTVALKDNHLQPSLIVNIQGGKAPSELNKQIEEKFSGVLLKLSQDNTAEQCFEKVCFELENNN